MATAKTLRIIRPNGQPAEPILISLPGLNQVQFIQLEEPGGFEEVSSNQVVESVILYGSDSEDSGISDENDREGYHSNRKRQRLDHLSLDEKIQRRKLKNRVAAQTARDKKKAKMDELEDIVRALQKKNKQLHEENQRLHAANQKLVDENSHLINAREKQSKSVTCPKKANRGPSSNLPFEPAEGTRQEIGRYHAEHSYTARPPFSPVSSGESCQSIGGTEDGTAVPDESSDRLSPVPDDVCDSLLQWLMQSLEESPKTPGPSNCQAPPIDEQLKEEIPFTGESLMNCLPSLDTQAKIPLFDPQESIPQLDQSMVQSIPQLDHRMVQNSCTFSDEVDMDVCVVRDDMFHSDRSYFVSDNDRFLSEAGCGDTLDVNMDFLELLVA